ncbi:6-phosphofructokinase [Thalassotalea sp. PLHSN55]|uniref:6-phosphofructokinase n=1 Tax=Thalassotalea sp. PLHSN55 TaxID=3435888 RepID=UPI003F82470F
MIKRIGILTSGGDAPGMNAAIRSVVLSASHFDIEVLGFYHGYNGLIADNSKIITSEDVDSIIQLGGTILKSARCAQMLEETGLIQAATTLLKNKVDALIVIGGDGSFNGLLSLQQHWSGKIIGIPGTIDNDLDGTDHTIGFSTAVNTALDAIDKIRDTADAFERVFIIELMGRHSGHITFNVGIACAAEQVLSFENFTKGSEQQTLQDLAKDIKAAKANHHHSYIIVVAEHLWQGGVNKLAEDLSKVSNIDCTACVLGYIQRGGSPDAKDRITATKMGVAAVQGLLDGKSGYMVGEQNNSIAYLPLNLAVKHTKTVSDSLVRAQDNILALTAKR